MPGSRSAWIRSTSVKDEDLLGMVETNVVGLVRVTRALLPRMIAALRGHVINLGSYAARGVYEGGAVYAATKHSVRVISETLRLELSGTNIRVIEIDPGLAETEFSIVRLGASIRRSPSIEASIRSPRTTSPTPSFGWRPVRRTSTSRSW